VTSAALRDHREAVSRALGALAAGALGEENVRLALADLADAADELERCADRASGLMDDMSSWIREGRG